MAGIERGAMVRLAELTPHPKNYNAHPPEQVEELRRSLRTFGQVRDVVTWQQYVIAGHGVAEAARAEGWTEISATRLPDDWPEERVLAYLATDNETARLSRPDEAQLAALLNAVSDEKLRALAAGGEARLRELMRPAPPADQGPQIDRAGELQEKWQVQSGQVWLCGCHVLICGDCKDVELGNFEIDLVLTDPPYGIQIVKVGADGAADSGGAKPVTIGTIRSRQTYPFGGIKNRAAAAADGGSGMIDATLYRPVYGDDEPFDPSWLLGVGKNQIIFGGNYFASRLPDSRCWIIWDKNNTGNFADAELAWTSFDKSVVLYKYTWNGLVRQGPRAIEGIRRVHPTQKPAGLMAEILNDFSVIGDCVFDPYLGSGSTLVGCEVAKRRGIGIEIDPCYCAVTLQRLADMGLEPRLAA